jgi:hypothetical protein
VDVGDGADHGGDEDDTDAGGGDEDAVAIAFRIS